jgi:hypothetical protein
MAFDMTNAIETTDLVKSFGDTRALDGLRLAIRGGSVYEVRPEWCRKDNGHSRAHDTAQALRRRRTRARAGCGANASPVRQKR